jgi:hypothetical protein
MQHNKKRKGISYMQYKKGGKEYPTCSTIKRRK